MPNNTVCLTFDFDAMSVWFGYKNVTPAMLYRGEYGARVGVPRHDDVVEFERAERAALAVRAGVAFGARCALFATLALRARVSRWPAFTSLTRGAAPRRRNAASTDAMLAVPVGTTTTSGPLTARPWCSAPRPSRPAPRPRAGPAPTP